MSKTARLFPVIFSLWLVWFIRAHDILALPVFVDESLHILRAQVVFDFSDAAASFLPGKLLTYYYLGAFNPQNHNGLWLSRQAVALTAPLSAAFCFAIVKSLTRDFRAGMLVIGLYAVTPFMVFFERMALADPFALSFGLGCIWMSIQLARHLKTHYAVFAGLLLGCALLAKLTALPLALVPMLALVFFTKYLKSASQLTRMRKILFICYGVAFLILLLPGSYMVYQEAAQVENKTVVVDNSLFIPQDQSRIAQIVDNLEAYAQATRRLTEPLGLMLVLALPGIALRPREGGFLVVIFLLILGFLVLVSAFPTSRYLTLGFPLLLILFTVVIHAVFEFAGFSKARQGASASCQNHSSNMIATAQGEFQWAKAHCLIKQYFAHFYKVTLVLMGVLGIRFALFAGDFVRDTWQDPTRHHLGAQDEWEYFAHTSSGYGLREAAAVLSQMQREQPILVVGHVGSCHSLRLYFPAQNNIILYCPDFPFYDNPALATSDDVRLTQPAVKVILLTESLEKIDQQATVTFPRPHDGVPVQLIMNRNETDE